jgi:hypothetical protein
MASKSTRIDLTEGTECKRECRGSKGECKGSREQCVRGSTGLNWSRRKGSRSVKKKTAPGSANRLSLSSLSASLLSLFSLLSLSLSLCVCVRVSSVCSSWGEREGEREILLCSCRCCDLSHICLVSMRRSSVIVSTFHKSRRLGLLYLDCSLFFLSLSLSGASAKGCRAP